MGNFSTLALECLVTLARISGHRGLVVFQEQELILLSKPLYQIEIGEAEGSAPKILRSLTPIARTRIGPKPQGAYGVPAQKLGSGGYRANKFSEQVMVFLGFTICCRLLTCKRYRTDNNRVL